MEAGLPRNAQNVKFKTNQDKSTLLCDIEFKDNALQCIALKNSS